MNRALLIAAVGLLGSGCYVSNSPQPPPDPPLPSYGDVTFYWRFQGADGALAGNFTASNAGCDVAGVTTIRIAIDNTTQDLNCVEAGGIPGITLTNFVPGRYSFTIQGYRGAEEIFADGGTVDVYSGQLTKVDSTLVVSGRGSTLPVYYSQNGRLSCDGSPYLAFELDDQFGNPVDIVPSNVPLACGTSDFGFLVNTPTANDVLEYGTYRFRYITLFRQTLSGPEAMYQVCGYTFVHQGFRKFIDLPPVTGTCP